MGDANEEDTTAEMANDGNGDKGSGNIDEVSMGGGEGDVARSVLDIGTVR